MKIKGLLDEDFLNYKKPSMFIEFPYCTFKCDKEAGCTICQNSDLANAPDIDVQIEDVLKRYIDNPITKAIVLGGLEPLDSVFDVITLIDTLRNKYNNEDDIVIYTGYNKPEVLEMPVYADIKRYKNIIIKFGRFIPNKDSIVDEVLGVKLASNNQFAERIS